MTTCYHCSQPLGDHYVVDAPDTIYHPSCYATAAAQESCSECGAIGPDVFVVPGSNGGGYLLPIHGACVAGRARRLALR